MTGRRRVLLVTALALGGVAAWIFIDLNNHTRDDLRRFDPREVARLETGMWRSYYGHESVRLFTALIDLRGGSITFRSGLRRPAPFMPRAQRSCSSGARAGRAT